MIVDKIHSLPYQSHSWYGNCPTCPLRSRANEGHRSWCQWKAHMWFPISR